MGVGFCVLGVSLRSEKGVEGQKEPYQKTCTCKWGICQSSRKDKKPTVLGKQTRLPS